MTEPQYDIIFRGDIVLGHQLADVKLRLQQLFKADAGKIDALFTGRPVPLKRNLDLASAQKYRIALMNAGAQVEVVTIATVKVQPLYQTVAQMQPPVEAQKINEHEAWTLAPVGSYLLPTSISHAVVPSPIDTSTLSLRPEGGNLLDSGEQKIPVVVNMTLPSFDVAEVGADLLTENEKLRLPIMDVEVGDWHIAELGVDMLDANEKPVTAVPTINIPDVSLAPAGADLGQIKLKIALIVPNIQGIELAKQ